MIEIKLMSVFWSNLINVYNDRMNPIDFQGQRSKIKVIMGNYGNSFVNMVEIKPLNVILYPLQQS